MTHVQKVVRHGFLQVLLLLAVCQGCVEGDGRGVPPEGLSVVEQAATASPTCVRPPDGIVAWWPGDGSAEDIVGNHSGTWGQYSDAFVGQGFALPGTLTVARFPLEAIAGDFSIEFWVQPIPPIVPTDRAPHEMFAKGANYTIGTANADPSGASCVGACNGRLEVRGPYPRPYSEIDTWGGGANSWSHITVTYGSGKYTIYVNGSAQPATAIAPLSILNNSLEATLGGDGVNAGAAFSGLLDEVTVYNRALGANEIQAIYAAGTAGKCKWPDLHIENILVTQSVGTEIDVNGDGVHDLVNQKPTLVMTDLIVTDGDQFARQTVDVEIKFGDQTWNIPVQLPEPIGDQVAYSSCIYTATNG